MPVLGKIEKLLLIKSTERAQVFYFLILFLLIGCGMALGRGTTDALFYKRYGIEYLPVMYIILSIFLMLVSTIYAAFSDLIPAERFFKILFFILIILLACNWILISFTNIQLAYPIYFLLYEIASELLLVHSTLYMSQNFDTQQAKRLSPLIFAGLQVGTICGGLFLATTATIVGVQNILLIWGFLILVSLVLTTIYHKRSGTSPYYRAARKSQNKVQQAVEQVSQGLKFARESELLRSLSIALFFMVIAFYVLCYSAGRIYTETFHTEEALTSFFGTLTVIFGGTALLMQIFLTNRVLRKYGVKKVNMVFPFTTLGSFGLLLASFSFPSALFGSFNKDAMMPAFRNPVRNLFFNALPNYMQGRARAMAVALVLPIALAVAGGLLVFAQSLDNPQYFLIIGAIASLCYLYYSIRMNRAYVSGIVSVLREKVFLPGKNNLESINSNDAQVLQELIRGIEHHDDDVSLPYADALIKASPGHASKYILPRLKTADYKVVNQLIPKLTPINPEGFIDFLIEHLDKGDAHHKSTAMIALVNLLDNERLIKERIEMFLDDTNPRIKAAAIHAVLKFEISDLLSKARQKLEELLSSTDSDFVIPALQLLEHHPVPDYFDRVIGFLVSDNVRILNCTLDVINRWPENNLHGLEDALNKLVRHTNSEVRIRALQCARKLPANKRCSISEYALEDEHPAVRAKAVETRLIDEANRMDLASHWIIDSQFSPRAQEAILLFLIDHNPSADILKSIAYAKAADAREYSHARDILVEYTTADSAQPATELLGFILDERLEQAINLSLMATEHFEDPTTIGVIRASLRSGDSRHIANASEALRHINNQKLANIFAELLDDLGHLHLQEARQQFPNLKAILEWCCSRSDEWLKQPAEFAMKGL